MTKKNILVISYVPNYNRQGYDITECLQKAGYEVRLVQMNGVSDIARGIIGVKCIKPHGIFHKFHMLYNLGFFFIKTVFCRKHIIICVGKPMLILCGFYHIIFRSKLIWYSLEYSYLGLINRFVYRHCVAGYIDVEENRRDAVFAQYGKKDNSIICYNMPHLHLKHFVGGRLKQYLKEMHGLTGNEKLVVYAGSYQKYARLETIVQASCAFPSDVRLVVMAYGLPDALKSLSPNCYIVPPVQGEDFYEWLFDANCALLPYEDEGDFNVRNCSPQKLFDCFVVGVPFIASNCPIVRKTLLEFPSVGVLCNFMDPCDICSKINTVLNSASGIRIVMQNIHCDKYNYNRMDGIIKAFVESIYA